MIEPDATVRALVIFARFPDSEVRPQCDTTEVAWPDPLELPAWADSSIIEDKAVPTKEGSLSHFYYEMSQGDHILKGKTFPEVVLTPDSLKTYCLDHSNDFERAMWAANLDVLGIAAASLGDSLFNYDENDDGVLDYVFIYYDSNKSTAGDYFLFSDLFTGVSETFGKPGARSPHLPCTYRARTPFGPSGTEGPP